MKNIFKTIVILAASVMAAGCIQEAVPQGSTQTEAQVAKSPVALEAMLRGIPASMTATNTAGYVSDYGVHTDFGIGAIHLMTDFMLEDLATMGDNPYYNRFYVQCMNRAQGSKYIYCAYYWDCYYPWIKIANDVIKTINGAGVSATTKVSLGQAYCYRAACYLDLARMYEPKENKYTDVSNVLGLTVPIVTEETTEEMAKNNPRAKREDMYAFILSDLEKAMECLKDAAFDYTKPSLALAQGLAARAYLEMGYWNDGKSAEYFQKAAELAKTVISTSGRIALTETEWHDPTNGFNNGAANKAWIWGETLSSENQGNIMTFTAHIASEGTWGYAPLSHIGANRSFYEAISDKDWRKKSWLSPEFMADVDNPDYANTYKFAGSAEDKTDFLKGSSKKQIPAAMAYQAIKFRPAQGECSDYNVGNCADHCNMRIEEMYFIQAEAEAHSDLAKGKATLESFIKTRNSEYTSSTRDLEGWLKNDLLFQKRIEFWGEGILFYDYKRLDAGITRGYPGTNEASVYRYNTDGRSPQWNFVITRGEFQSNIGVNDDTNNPDPTDKLKLWQE